jgi:tetratricopeptide (TPR) repeat protein
VRRASTTLAACWLLLAVDVRAQPDDPPLPVPNKAEPGKPDPLADAKELANKGYELFQAGHYAEAIAMFRQAEELEHSPVILSYIAQSYEALGQLLEAQAQYSRIINESLPDDANEDHKRAQQRARKLMPQLQERIPKLRLTIRGVAVAELKVELDGRKLTETEIGQPILVNPGRRTLVLQAPGVPVVERPFTATERQTSEVDVVFALDPGNGHGATAPPDRSWVAPVVAFGLGFAGLTLGAVCGGLYLAGASSLEDRCPDDRCAPELEEEADTLQTLGILSLVGLGVAVAGTAIGVTFILLDDDEASTALIIGPGALSLRTVW